MHAVSGRHRDGLFKHIFTNHMFCGYSQGLLTVLTVRVTQRQVQVYKYEYNLHGNMWYVYVFLPALMAQWVNGLVGTEFESRVFQDPMCKVTTPSSFSLTSNKTY